MSRHVQDQIIAVTGATGQQGGATAAALLARGHPVRAVVRDPSGAAARELEKSGAELVAGDMGDRSSLEAAFLGVHGVFSVQPTFVTPELTPGIGPGDEVRFGRNVADAAMAAGVRHFVYASSVNADADSGIETLENKGRIEEHIRVLGLPATMLRPVSFMENYLAQVAGQALADGELSSALRSDTVQQLIALRDIGEMAALAFERPEEYVGEVVDLAGDELTPPQIADALSRATGRPVRHVEIPIEVIRQQSENLANAYAWMNDNGPTVDISALRARKPDLRTFEEWLAEQTLDRTGLREQKGSTMG
ncbi:NmrA/HSCARG family protein [Saccharopolyspora taberi]|uniref:NmrA/HSCARG family protein n=1 Tax=Saccharopolyspora taberi TaxID=60895 RepID=A0ABN3VK25_9PSEU